MSAPQPPQQPGVPPGYPQQAGYQQQPGYPGPQGYAPQPGHPQAYQQPQQWGQQQWGQPQQPPQGASAVPARVLGVLAIIIGLAITLDFAFSNLVNTLICVPAGLALIAGGVLLILRHWIGPFLLIGATVLCLAFLVKGIVLRATSEYLGGSLGEILYSFAEVITLVPTLIVTALSLLPFTRNGLKPRSATAQAPAHYGAPQYAAQQYPGQQYGTPQAQQPAQQPYPQQQYGAPQQYGGYPPPQ
ncbi:hypothetical protein [Saccharopolyspora sp. CA-218241]|uniref:hypothetical protein n=1 Tax=Saccharopolyspora sp. CA-218241 TaxID=3240027 RepID=UPI003D97E59B